ncbi:MAG: hypothetical protein Q7W30_10625 [Coriobacteriia bacterium]|nr:hypothetical protein [Coriobacteriia bacterium]
MSEGWGHDGPLYRLYRDGLGIVREGLTGLAAARKVDVYDLLEEFAAPDADVESFLDPVALEALASRIADECPAGCYEELIDAWAGAGEFGRPLAQWLEERLA